MSIINSAGKLQLAKHTLGITLAVRTIVGEADGEPDIGQQGVAHTLLNRLLSGHFGASLGAVCLAERHGTWQYDCWMPSDPNFAKILAMPDDYAGIAKATKNFMAALTAPEDFTDGAMYYYSKLVFKTDPPPFFRKLIFCCEAGNQKFFR